MARLAARPARRVTVDPDLVVLEVAGEFGGVLVLEQPLEAPPGGVARLLAAALGEIEVLDDLIQVDVPVADDRFVGFFVLEFVSSGFSLMPVRVALQESDGANLNQIT